MRRMSEPLQAKVKSKVITAANVTPVAAAGVSFYLFKKFFCVTEPDVQTSKYVSLINSITTN